MRNLLRIASTGLLAVALAAAAPGVRGVAAQEPGVPTPAAPAPPERPLLSLGDRGQSVAAWQRQLNLATGAGLVVDGIYGSTTEQATVNVQRFFGLRVDGIVGPSTRDVVRYVLASTRDWTHLATYEGFEVAGFQSEGGYCFEVLSGDVWNVECGPPPPYPVTAMTIELDGLTPVLLGTTDPTIGQVLVETGEGPGLPADLVRDVRGLDRAVWTTPLDPSTVTVIRALANDGSEVRAIVFDDGVPLQVLERGDVGPAVAAWQGRLNVVTGAGLATDGVFGEMTVQATMDFQRFFGLRVDGIVGAETRDVMAYIYGLVASG